MCTTVVQKIHLNLSLIIQRGNSIQPSHLNTFYYVNKGRIRRRNEVGNNNGYWLSYNETLSIFQNPDCKSK